MQLNEDPASLYPGIILSYSVHGQKLNNSTYIKLIRKFRNMSTKQQPPVSPKFSATYHQYTCEESKNKSAIESKSYKSNDNLHAWSY